MHLSHISPPSSPTFSSSSSPSLGPCDSSPPSSPSHEPLSLSPPASPGVVHPFAGSTKAVREPRIHEKRAPRVGYGHISFRTDLLEDPETRSRDDHTTPMHPLAGSAKTNWMPPDWEKKPSRTTGRTVSIASISSSDTLEPARLFAASGAFDDEVNLSDDEDALSGTAKKSRRELEEETWETAITAAIDRADGIINLENSGVIGTGLSRISSSIGDLASLVVLPSTDVINPTPDPPTRKFTRARTMPTATLAPPISLSDQPSRLVKSPSMAHMRPQDSGESRRFLRMICLYLANNSITKLPLELFWLQGLTVLNLRGNALKRVPPQIAQLRNLRMLILAQNKLSYLPAEMLRMHLTLLNVGGNPWLEPPVLDNPTAAGDAPSTSTESASAPSPTQPSLTTPFKITTPTTSHYTIPPLAELCLRTLLSPHHPAGGTDARRETVLEALHTLPLPDGYPESILHDLRACCPRAVAKPDERVQSPSKRARSTMERSYSFGSATACSQAGDNMDDEDDDEETHPGVGACMSLAHQGAAAVFVRHAEERFTWERVVAGVDVGEAGGVPVLWRGCSRGCLGFLDGGGGAAPDAT